MGVELLKLFRFFEEEFGGDCEEFRRVSCAVAVEKGLLTVSDRPAEFLEIFLEHPCPGDKVRAALQNKGAVAFTG